ncbi:hypothetical protein BDV34DRAFT_237091 [Aspergillus parasiticus]|uniref:Geranylgeranyl pyrophosphate synthetase n=1 Tax=Aspergillus parasiticus TaxID=5067 RepID=A0A5N6DDN2_ASPPA|nr:hypothetical protein BDV34DRAFT_237091 [Aspergillus parasiticus]
MTSARIASISRKDLDGLEDPAPSITDIKHPSSYNWMDSVTPTIAIPGCPPLWSPPGGTRRVPKYSGLIYIAQNAARHLESPLEPLFRALYLITDRNNVRKLLSFINPSLSKKGLEPFTVEIEVTSKTALFCRAETETVRFLGPDDFAGFSHEFEKAYTRDQVSGSTGHHRIISYSFGGLRLIVRYETDGYVIPLPCSSVGTGDDLSSMMESLSLRPTKCVPCATSAHSKLILKADGQTVAADSILELKTRVGHKPISMQGVLPQLWVSQSPNLIRAYHRNGIFGQPKVDKVLAEVRAWEESHAEDLKKLSCLFRKMIHITKENGGKAILQYDVLADRLEIWTAVGRRMLPDDLYFTLDHVGTEAASNEKVPGRSDSSKTELKIGHSLYHVGLSMIPYLESCVRFDFTSRPHGSEYTHSDIPLFDTALKGLESGYRFCFRPLPVDPAQYHVIWETYDFLRVDVLGGQTIDRIFVDLRACKTDYGLDHKRYRAIKANFKDEERDSAKVYNAMLFVLFHPGTFKPRTRTMVCAAYEERFVVSYRQKATLDRWNNSIHIDGASDDDRTTDDSSEPYYSHDSH